MPKNWQVSTKGTLEITPPLNKIFNPSIIEAKSITDFKTMSEITNYLKNNFPNLRSKHRGNSVGFAPLQHS
ncbi:MAG: hypothetical protein IPO92_02360 [Saprospiraceae bacterium]|nr:hypothetical protein [Saprospiraceae bacterium]